MSPATTYRIRHVTRYEYDEPVTSCVNLARLEPRDAPLQEVTASRLIVRPSSDDQRSHGDAYGNNVTYFSIGVPHQTLEVAAESEVLVRTPPALRTDGESWEASVLTTATELEPAGDTTGQPTAHLHDFVLPSRLVPTLAEVAGLAQASFPPGRPAREAVLDLLARLHDEVEFNPGVTSVATPLSDVVASRRGVCQDFAHLAVACFRAMGLAARYVSGYLETDPPPGQPRLVGADASHAWCAVWLRNHGWLDLDPTNGQVPDGRHITLAWGRDYADVAPLKGVVFSGGSNQRLTVEVDVTRVAA